MRQLRWSAPSVVALVILSACSGSSSASSTAPSSHPGATLVTTTPAVSTVASATSTVTTAATTAATVATTTTVPALKVPLDHTVKPGEHSEAVAYIQDRLTKLGFDPGPVDGTYGTTVEEAVWAFQTLIGSRGKDVADTVSPALWDRMQDPLTLKPRDALLATIRHVEIYLPEQALVVFDDGGAVKLISHISSGNGKNWCENGWCGVAVTPSGVYSVQRFRSGWEHAPLGLLYNPVYFNGGIAMHGALVVPNYPASHGCIRLPLNVATYFPTLLQRGDPVLVYDGVKDPRDYGSPRPPVNTTDPKWVGPTVTESSPTTAPVTTAPGATTVPATTAPGATTVPATTAPKTPTTAGPTTTKA